MPIDWTARMLDPIYRHLGLTATITPPERPGFAVTVIDKTAGIQTPGDVAVPTIRPAAVIRVKEMLGVGLVREDLDAARITFNGATWTITATEPRPTPGGEADGELLLWLTAAPCAEEATEEPSEADTDG